MLSVAKYEPNQEMKKQAHIGSFEQYKKMYDFSVNEPEAFWSEQAERISWFKKWDKVWEWNFNKADTKWFEGASLNFAENLLRFNDDSVAIEYFSFLGEHLSSSLVIASLHLSIFDFLVSISAQVW